MCGIAGIVGSEEPDRLLDMLGLMQHRGPDHLGFHHEAEVSLGMTRLAIIDLATGEQPMADPRHKLWVVFNGEIYNFRELRKTLQQKDPTPFLTQSDTEVLLRAYEAWGEDCVQHFRGMFTFAIWDGRKSQALLARDRLGKKPLYYGLKENKLIFASELKSVLASGYFDREVNPQAVDDYLTLRYPFGEESFIRNIYKLPPGHLLKFRHGKCEIQPYWTPPLPEGLSDGLSHERRKEKDETRLWQLLLEATRLRLVSDVPLGVLLSGGLDSSAVVGLMAELGVSPINTFTIGYPKGSGSESCDETRKARQVAQYFGTEHHEIEMSPLEVETLPKLLWHLDEPIADEAILPTYFLCKEAKKAVTVLLTGEGADEVFGGYPRYQLHRWLEPLQWASAFRRGSLLNRGLRVVEKFPLPPRYRNACQKIAMASNDSIQRNLDWVQVFSEEEKTALYTRDFQQSLQTEKLAARLDRLFPPDHSRNGLGDVIFLDQKTWLVEDILMKLDKMSMAASVEARAPFLDHPLVEFMGSLPLSMKVSRFQTKRLFKKVVERILPKWIVRQEKQAFRVPLEGWFKSDLKDFVRDQLLSERALKRGQFNPNVIKCLVDEHFSGRRNFHAKIFTLLCFELWNQIFLDSRNLSSAKTSLTL